ncbi:trypsin Inhibitor like cysteine rich domain protein, partial [Ostertagia ostertagi]
IDHFLFKRRYATTQQQHLLIRNVTSSGHHSNTTIGPILLNTTTLFLSGGTQANVHVHQLNTTTSPQPLHITISPSNTTQHDHCGANEVYSQCVPHCQTTCRGVEECSASHGPTCTSGCTCKSGYRRNGRGKCVLPRHCYLAPGCKNNETWSKCATCERKCADTNQICTICYSGCACNEGYARNSSNLCTLR